MTEIKSLKTILSETHTNLVVNHEFQDALQDQQSVLLSALGPTAPAETETKKLIESCRKELEILVTELKKKGQGHRFGWERFNGPFLAKSTQQSVGRLYRQCQSLNSMVSIDAALMQVQTQKGIKNARKEWHGADENRKVLTWLSQANFEQKHQDVLSKHHPGTAQWLLDLDRFKAWRNGHCEEPSIIWCPGIRKSAKASPIHPRLTCPKLEQEKL